MSLSGTESHAYMSAFTHCIQGEGVEMFHHPVKSAEVMRLFLEGGKESKGRRNRWSRGRFTVVEQLPMALAGDGVMRECMALALERGERMGINDAWLEELAA